MPAPDDAERFESTAEYYAEYRPGYGDAAVAHLVERFGLDDSASVLDLGCGAGQLTVPLARRAGAMVAMDPNEAMLDQARKRVRDAGLDTVEFVVGSDSDLGDHLGPLRLTTMGRSFHWMDERRTLQRLHGVTDQGGGVALLTDREWLTRGRADWQVAVHAVAAEYADVPPREDPDEPEYGDPWDELLAECGFEDVETRTFDVARDWTIDGVVGYLRSLSFCSPRILGDDEEPLVADVRALLDERPGETFRQETQVEVISGRVQG